MGLHVSRRVFIGTSAGAITAMLSGCRSEEETGRNAEPIFLDYDKAGLDAAYDQRVWAANMTEVSKRREFRSEQALARLGEPGRYRYGSTDIEALDWYRTHAPDAPIHVFLHGGAWRGGSARVNAFAAEAYVDAGAHFVIPDYIKVQNAGGDLRPLAQQVRRAVAWVYENARSFDADPSQILVSGHSAGGHLAGVVLVTDWEKDFGLPVDTVKNGLCSSGMFDLYPVSLSSRNEYVAFDDEMVAALSPIRHLDHLSADLVVAFGANESPEFQRQSRDFYSAVTDLGKPAQLLVGQGMNHFEILETLGDPYGLLGRAALALMGLDPWRA